MDYFEFYKDLYHRENDRRITVENTLNIPIAIISAIGTVIYFVITSFDYSIEPFLSYIFILLCSISTICLIFSIYYLIRAFCNFPKRYEYSGIPYPNELLLWHESLEKYYGENDLEIDENSKKHFQDFLIQNFVKHTSHNMFVNDQKYRYIYNSKMSIITGLVILMITMIPFGYNYFKKKDTIHKIELTERISILKERVEINKK